MLFNLVLEKAVRKMKINPNGTILDRMVEIMA